MAEQLPYGIVVEFETPEELLAATIDMREHGYTEIETYTPYPVEGLAEPLNLHERLVPKLCFLGGFVGAGGAFAMQFFTNWDYPINAGGRAQYAVSGFSVIAFELMILGAVIFAAFGMLILNRLPRLHHPIFSAPHFERASNDRFFLCIRASDPKFSRKNTMALMRRIGGNSAAAVEQ